MLVNEDELLSDDEVEELIIDEDAEEMIEDELINDEEVDAARPRLRPTSRRFSERRPSIVHSSSDQRTSRESRMA